MSGSKNEPHEKVPLTRASRKAYGVTFDTEIKDTVDDGDTGHMPDLSLTSVRKKPEAPVFRFEAAPDDETIDDNVLDYEAAHYTEEQVIRLMCLTVKKNIFGEG